MEKISQELIDELNKVKVGITDGSCKGIEVRGYRLDRNYGKDKNGNDRKPGVLKNSTILDVINLICDTNYYFDCRKRAVRPWEEKLKKDPNAVLQAKDGALAAYPFENYRYLIQEGETRTNFAYLKHLGTQLFDGDFDIKSNKVTLDEAKAYSKEIMNRLYARLNKYNWFIFECESTSAKGIHIYTYSKRPEFDLTYNEDGTQEWHEMTQEEYIAKCIKYFLLNYQMKLYCIYKELEGIWEELCLEDIQPLDSFFDNAMYRPNQPFNITPMHKGNILLNPNFRAEIDIELTKYVSDNSINDIRDIQTLDSHIVDIVAKNLEIKEDHTTQEDLVGEFDTVFEIKSSDYDMNKSKSKSGFYFGHGTRHKTAVKDDEGNDVEVECPLIKEVIHTLKCFYDDKEIEKIWLSDGFYNQDANEANVITWIKNWKEYDDNGNEITKDKYIPKRSVVDFLNKWCGFDIRYEDYTIYKQDKDKVDIWLKDDEYLADYWSSILKAIDNKPGIYMIISPTGSGKTHTHVNINKKLTDDFMNRYIERPVLITEPYNSISISKFNDNEIEIVVGHKRFPDLLNSHTMYATNYVHFDQLDIDDIKQFKYIIIDESHLVTHEKFRGKQLSEFIKKIRELCPYSIVMLQTATPMDERLVFDIKKTFHLHKEDKRHISYKYVKFDTDDKFDLTWTYNMIHEKLKNNIKTYVYLNNIGLRQAKVFASLFEHDTNVAVYHKRIIEKGEYEGSAMEAIDKTHELGEYGLLISSVYFGVGNDLNDQVENACCFIIGNNSWQEDVQVFGRWRNTENIEVICVYTSKVDYNRYNYNKLLHYKVKNIKWNLNDRTNRNKSNVIWSSIENEEDANLWGVMEINELYHSSKPIKDAMLPLYVDEYFEEVEMIQPDTSMVENVKDLYKELSSADLSEKQGILQSLLENKNAEIKYKGDPKFDRWIKAVKRLRYNVPDDVFTSVVNKLKGYSIIHPLELYCSILKQFYDNSLDYGEIAAFETYRNSEKTDDDMIHSFLIWYFYHNYDENSYEILGNWWFEYKWKCKNYSLINKELIDFLYSDNKILLKKAEIKQLESMEEIFGEGTFNDEIEKIKAEQVVDYDPNGKITLFRKTKESVDSIVNWILEHDKKVVHQLTNEDRGKAKKKTIIICNDFKHKDKYGLKAGQTFMSCDSLAKKCNVNINTVSKWIKKKWVVEAI